MPIHHLLYIAHCLSAGRRVPRACKKYPPDLGVSPTWIIFLIAQVSMDRIGELKFEQTSSVA